MSDRELATAPQETLHGRYAIQRRLGKKAGRQTLLAQDLETPQLVIIKLLTFGSSLWEDFKLFEREIETLKTLSHPAIPRYLDSFEIETRSGQGFAMVQTYIEAKSLEEYLEEGRTFSEGEIKQLAKSLLEILIYLHSFHPPVIHRDLKPSNILLGERSGNSIGRVYLVDFGSVQTLASKEGKTVTVVGTYGYMPPEQFGGRAVPASDLYSLGATLIALMTKSHPADLPQKDLRIQFAGIETLPAQSDPDLIDWLQWITEPSLDRRCHSPQVALDALEKPRYLLTNSCLDKRHQFTTARLFLHIIPSSIGMGILTGGVFGGLFGTSIIPLFGTVAGALVGSAAGVVVGLLNGLSVGILTRLHFFPLRDVRRYRYSVKFVGFICGYIATLIMIIPLFIQVLLYGFTAALSSIPIAIIAGLSMSLANKKIARWYEQETRK